MSVLRERIPLLEVRPELTRDLTAEERAEVAGIRLPVVSAGPGRLDLDELLRAHKAFGATVFEGLVIGSLRIADQTGIHLLGPGDMLSTKSDLWPAWLGELQFEAAAPLQLSLLGNDLLVALHRWPRIVQGFHASVGEQLHRLSSQLVICQLPRVEDRVVAMLWLLAESWGHVTPGGVRLPLTLTHETLGALVGARRPTVTLALRKLTDEGALVAQDSGWLLLQPPPDPPGDDGERPLVQVASASLGKWASVPVPRPAPDPSRTYAELREIVEQLRERHRNECQQTRERLERVRTTRARTSAARKQIAELALRRRRPPSS